MEHINWWNSLTQEERESYPPIYDTDQIWEYYQDWIYECFGDI